jgi:hypothetical protein
MKLGNFGRDELELLVAIERPSVEKGMENVPLRKKRSHTLFTAGGTKVRKARGSAVKAGGVEGHPVCTNEVRKIGEEAAPSP